MPRRGRIPERIRDQVLADLHDGVKTQRDIALEHGVSLSFVKKQQQDISGGVTGSTAPGVAAKVRWESRSFGPPKLVDELGSEARRALEDIEFFARRYYGIILLPWQVMAAARIVELLGTPYEEYAAINVAPGSGKTVFFGRIVPTWLTARDRAMRGMVGSATNTVAVKITDQLRRDFTRPRPDHLTERDRRQGLVQVEAVLAEDFGRFRPDVDGSLWTRNEFEVAQLGDTMMTQKEPTWAAFGRDTTFIGWRADFILWDDLWDVRKLRSADTREDFYSWFDNTAETRLEPGGLFLLQGQRLEADDVYSYALGKTLEDDLEELGPDDGSAPMRYHHIVYKAWDDDHPHAHDAEWLRPSSPPWPEGPLLSPQRLPWRRLNGIRKNRPDMFALTYQQSPDLMTETLVNKLWVQGGVSSDGEYLPGCLDLERRLWEVPADLAEPIVSVAMTDPSVTNRWGHLWYLWQPSDDGVEDIRHVMAVEQRKMSADMFLDWNNASQVWHGLMEDWWQSSNELGKPIRWWIVEQNAAHRYLLQHEHVRRWMLKRGVTIIGHDTHRNKADPQLGVQALVPPVWRRGLIRVPYADAKVTGPTRRMDAFDFVSQMTKYPQARFDDLVMASWFFENKRDVMRPARTEAAKLRRPGFMKMLEKREVA